MTEPVRLDEAIDVVILEMSTWDDLRCAANDGPASWMFSMRCCGGGAVFTCQEHHDGLVDELERNRRAHPGVSCKYCGRHFEAPPAVSTFVRVVGPL